MPLITPPDTAHFTCVGALPLPSARVHRGCSVKLFPESYFRSWSREVIPDRRVYLGAEFSRSVLSTLEPVTVTHDAVRRAVYCWKSHSGAPVTWGDVYRNFPKHGPSPENHQVAPWQHLQELVFGWGGTQAVVPRNDRGALLMLGDAGLSKVSPSGATTIGRAKFLVQVSFFASVGPATWVLGLPQKETSDQLCPPDMILLTVR